MGPRGAAAWRLSHSQYMLVMVLSWAEMLPVSGFEYRYLWHHHQSHLHFSLKCRIFGGGGLRSRGTLGVFRWCRSFQKNGAIAMHILISEYFSKKKYLAISTGSRAHSGERNEFISHIRRSYRRSKPACNPKLKKWQKANLKREKSKFARA